ncbi:serine hydrolase domain-containing protein [Microbacterium aoyamense]|nr:serine hydrolase domain-containing protein [Microbacterium aoyamense]
MTPDELGAALDETARGKGMSGTIRIDVEGETVFAGAYGLADRGHGIPNTTETRFAVASLSKGFTAIAVMSLVQDGLLSLDTRVRSVLGSDLPLVDDDVTIEQLLAHTSGIGDYLDEEADWEVDDYVLTLPVHTLTDVEAFVPMLDGFPQKTPPGETFQYNNGGFMLLALVAQRASGTPFHELVQARVLDRAGLPHTGYLRTDELPGDAALGYLYEDPASLRTNLLHLPIRGSGDGGAFTTASDISTFWRAFVGGRIVDAATRDLMTAPRNVDEDEDLRYGLGLYLDEDGPGLILTGYDAGVSAWTRHDPQTGLTVTILSNSSEGAWPVVRRYIDEMEG